MKVLAVSMLLGLAAVILIDDFRLLVGTILLIVSYDVWREGEKHDDH